MLPVTAFRGRAAARPAGTFCGLLLTAAATRGFGAPTPGDADAAAWAPALPAPLPEDPRDGAVAAAAGSADEAAGLALAAEELPRADVACGALCCPKAPSTLEALVCCSVFAAAAPVGAAYFASGSPSSK